MSRTRLAPALLIVALSTPLAGCGGGAGFDPTEMFNFSFLDTKKPLPGDRKPVFPEGVPGVDRGVPPDMIKGSAGALATRQQIEQAQQPQLQQQPQQSPGTTQAAAPADDEAPPASAPPPPAARPKAPAKRRSVTAPPPEPASEPAPAQTTQRTQPQPSPFPSPVPSGTFSR
jgi:hypothetical protein